MQQQTSQKGPYAVIRVIEPILQQPKNENIPAYVTYEVSGVDPHGEFSIRRRYRQFYFLRNKFVERFNGMYIPPIPTKKAVYAVLYQATTEQRFVERRRKFLNYFCQKIAQKPFLFDSDIFQTFIRGDPDFQRAVRHISTHQYALLANVYDVEFRKYVEEADMPKVLIELEKQTDILKRIQKTLNTVKEQTVQVAQAKTQFVKDYAYVFKEVLPRFQKEFIRHHDQSGKSEFINNNELCQAGLEQYIFFCQDNPLEEYVEMIDYDIRQARALLQAIDSRRHFENRKSNFETVRRDCKEELEKLKAGRTTLKSIFTSGNKQAQQKDLQTNIAQYQRNEAFLGMCLPLSAIAIHRDIINYKTTRSLDYLAKLQIIARKQMRLLDYYGNFLTYGLQKQKE